MSVAPTMIERQLRLLLARRLRPAGAADVAHGRGRLLHVTFDDAYTSVRHVLPVLERLRVPATVFAATGFVGTTLRVPELAQEAETHPHELETMGWDELRGLGERGVEVGSHTVSHPHLPRLTDEELARELVDSRIRLEDELGRRCALLAYPFGDEDRRVQEAARRAGYEAAFALPGRDSWPSRYAIPRVGVYQRDGIVRTALKTVTAVRRPAAAALRLAGRRA
jgi:peptidoglycan/xylan/chitin deacetylase (PgdA/CDA1 family)